MEVSHSPSVYVRHAGIAPWRPGLGKDGCNMEPRLWAPVKRIQLRLAAGDFGGSVQDVYQIHRETTMYGIL